MPYCLNCGDKLPDGEEECPKCHQKTEKRDSTDEAEVEIRETLPVKKSARKIWLIVSAVILVAAVSLVLLFTVFLPGSEPLIKTDKGNFTFAQNYTHTYSEYYPKDNYVFLVFDLTPVKGSKLSKDDEDSYSFKYIRAIIDDNSYSHFSQRTSFSPDGSVSMISFVFVVDEIHEQLGEVAELDLR